MNGKYKNIESHMRIEADLGVVRKPLVPSIEIHRPTYAIKRKRILPSSKHHLQGANELQSEQFYTLGISIHCVLID